MSTSSQLHAPFSQALRPTLAVMNAEAQKLSGERVANLTGTLSMILAPRFELALWKLGA
jgi:hypothetical protein